MRILVIEDETADGKCHCEAEQLWLMWQDERRTERIGHAMLDHSDKYSHLA